VCVSQDVWVFFLLILLLPIAFEELVIFELLL